MSNRKQRARVLVIDDDTAVLEGHARLLRRDYEVTAVSDAVDALDLLIAGERFKAIVCDVMMPRLDGLQFYRRVRLIDEATALIIVFVTGGASPMATKSLATLSNRVLEKPVTANDLREAVRRVVGQ